MQSRLQICGQLVMCTSFTFKLISANNTEIRDNILRVMVSAFGLALHRYLLAQTVQRSKPPDKINAANAYYFPVRETFRNRIQCDAVVGIVESRHQNSFVQDQEIRIAGR